MTVLSTVSSSKANWSWLQDGDPLPGADEDLALVRLDLAGEDLQKGRFAGAVGADQAVAVAGGELDVDVLEDDPLAVGKSDIGGVYHDECSVKVMSGACFLRWRRSGMSRWNRPAQWSGVRLGGLAQVVFVIALVDPHLAVVDLKDPVDQAAQEVAVMADQHDRAGELLQGVQQHLAGLDVEVVGRLVEDQQVERLGQQSSPEPPGSFRRRRGCRSACRHRRPERERRRRGCGCTPMFACGMASWTVSKTVCPGIEDVHGMLAEIAGADAGAEIRLPVVGSVWPADDLEEGRFAGAVDADHGDLLLPPDRAGDAAEDRFLLARRAAARPCRGPSSCTTSSPLRGGSANSNVMVRCSGGISIRSIFSIFLTRDWTWEAWEARAAKRAMNSSSLASISCWRRWLASSCSRRISRSRR